MVYNGTSNNKWMTGGKPPYIYIYIYTYYTYVYIYIYVPSPELYLYSVHRCVKYSMISISIFCI